MRRSSLEIHGIYAPLKIFRSRAANCCDAHTFHDSELEKRDVPIALQEWEYLGDCSTVRRTQKISSNLGRQRDFLASIIDNNPVRVTTNNGQCCTSRNRGNAVLHFCLHRFCLK